MEYQVRFFRDDDAAAVAAIIDAVWGAQAKAKFGILHPWFRARRQTFPARVDDDVVIDTEGVTAGYLRLIPCQYLVGGRRIDASYFADSVVALDHRGAGLQLARHVLKTPDILRIGVPAAHTLTIWRRLCRPRPVDLAPLERFVLLLNPSLHLQKKGVPRGLLRPVDWAWHRRVLGSVSRHGGRASQSHQVSTTADLPAADELDALFAEFARGFYGIAVRDRTFLKWRFADSPLKYQFVWVRDHGRLVGYAVYRQGEYNRRRVVLLVEAMAVGVAQTHYLLMLKQVCEFGLRIDAAEVQTLNSGCKHLQEAMKKIGMFIRPEKEVLLAHLASGDPIADQLTQNKPWFMSMAESDLEFSVFPFTGAVHEA